MARLSVYIPDEMLEHAKTLENSDNTSQLVQRGLQRLIDDQTRLPSYARAPERSWEQIIDLRERLLAEAREDYERGYALALEAASGMSLHVINALVDADFDLEKWLAPFKNGMRYDLMQKAEPIPVDQVEEALLASAAAPPPSDEQFKKSGRWWMWKTAEALGKFADPLGMDEFSFTPTKARQRGYIDALRELWSAIEKPGQSWSDSLHDLEKLQEEHQRRATEGGGTPRTGDADDS